MAVDSTKATKSWPVEVRKMPPVSSSLLCNQLDSALRFYRQFSNTTTGNFSANTHKNISVDLLQLFASYMLVSGLLSTHSIIPKSKAVDFNLNWLARR